MTNLDPSRRNLGMVFQRPSMFPHMTAFQNIAWGLKLRDWPKNDIPNRVQEMLALVHLDGMENRRFRQLSGGQAQRVVIARALAPNPTVLLLDEPLSALDKKLRDELILEIAEIHRITGRTTILVTHDQGEALTIADNVLLMNEGRIEQSGSPIDIYQNPRSLFAAMFIGTNNFLPGTIRDTSDGIAVKIDDLDITLHTNKSALSFEANEPVWVCIRADDIDVVSKHDANEYCNVIDVNVDHASLTGGSVIIEGKLQHRNLRIHLGGGRRFELLQSEGTTISCALSHIALIPRDEGELSASVVE